VNWDQRATIVTLVIIAIAVWGLGLRAALRVGARDGQELTANTAVTEAAVAANPPTSLPSATPTSWLNPGPATPTQTFTSTPSPTAIQPTPSPSRPASRGTDEVTTPTQVPSPTPSPTATLTQEPPVSPSPTLYVTPTVPQSGRFLLVNQDEQTMRVYEDGAEVRTIPVSTGVPVANAFTPAWSGNVGRYWGSGPFLNTNLWSDYMWYLFPGARGSILIHSVPYTRKDDTKIYDRPDALGVEPASHGCVRISPEDAQWLETWDPVGVPIEITPWSGEIGPPDESLEP
jgi:lipoprotein-anchoring transpeptidase ErfK/SrfK